MISDLDITNFIQDFKLNCVKAQIKSFEKGEIITTYLVNRNQMCILVNGNADLIRYDFKGNKNIIEHFSENSIFGEVFYQINTNNEFFVMAKKKCEVLFFPYDNFHKKCKKHCRFHDKLVEHLPLLMLSKMVDLNVHIEVLSKRGIREKILGYFTILSSQSLSKTFSLTYSFTDLADYLNVDRSAMMREIKSLKDDGIIKKIGNKITLLY